MTEPEEDLPRDSTNWKMVYFIVLAFLALFCLFMYIFTQTTA